MEFVYKFTRSRGLEPLRGGGPALNIYMFDGDGDDDRKPKPASTSWSASETPRGLFFEFKVGAIDSPDFKFGVG